MESVVTSVPDVVKELKNILVQDLLLGVTFDEIPDDYSLLEDGLALDSIVVEEFIVRVEDRFGVRFDDRVLSPELLSNLSMLGAFVAREQAATASRLETAGETPTPT
jgi:acyl carrier protein